MVSKMVGIKLAQGQRIRLETPGGGAYGPVEKRDPQQVRRDLELGYISREAVERDYGVKS